jgi:hypothetical protein
MSVIYSHRQKAWWVPLTCALFILVALGIYFSEGQELLTLATALPGMLIYWLFDGLLVEVSSSQIVLKFGHGPIKKTIERNQIAGANPVRNKAIYGWGIRLTPHGMLWNIYGLDAVELTYLNGKRFRIGSDDAKQLLTAILKKA